MTETETNFGDPPELSLVLGGPLHRIYRRLGLRRDPIELKYRRAIVISAFAWLPLLVFSMLEGHAYGTSVNLPFLRDITAHVRFLIALPALLLADSFAQNIIGPRVAMFVTRNIIRVKDREKFETAIAAAHRMRDSNVLEASLIVIVYAVTFYLWGSHLAIAGSSWHGIQDADRSNTTLAGYWLLLVSLPIFQFLLLRWYARLVIWTVFLYRVSRLELYLVAIHSDRSAGLAFLGACPYAFVPLLFAQGSLLSAYIASEVLYRGRSLLEFKYEAGGLVILFVGAALAPLLFFTPHIVKAKWRDLILYGDLATKYVEGFDERWISGGETPTKDLLGADDIQSLADLTNSYQVLQTMRPTAFTARNAAFLFAVTAVPLVPLAFLAFSLEDILASLLRILL